MQHQVNIPKSHILEALNVIHDQVIDHPADETVVCEEVVVYEDVVEEVVYDEILVLDAGLVNAMNDDTKNNDADASKAEGMIAINLITEAKKAETKIIDIITAEALNHKQFSQETEADELSLFSIAMDLSTAGEVRWQKWLADNKNADATNAKAFSPIRKYDACDEASTDDSTTDEAVSDDEGTISIASDLSSTGVALDLSLTSEEHRQKLLAQHTNDYNSMYMKISLLENWQESRLNILEHLAKQGVEFKQLNGRMEDLLEQLSEKNIEICEEDFLEFKRKQLAANPIYEPLDDLLMNDLAANPIFEPLDDLEVQQTQTTESKENQPKRIKISATSTPIRPAEPEVIKKFAANEDGLVIIGPNGTTIAEAALKAINWSLSGPALTRKILMEVFDRDTLAFHNLTGKPSPAFIDCDKPLKNQLNPTKVADVIHFTMEHTKLSAKEVRNAITTKCADENKMYRQREKKRQAAALQIPQLQENN